MAEKDVANRQRQVSILQCMVAKDEDEIIWTLSMNKDIMKKEIGFEYESRNRMCICGQMFEKLRHNNHIFHIEKLSGWVLEGRCPHVEQTTDNVPQHAATTFLHCACALGKLRVIKFLVHEHDCSLNEATKATLFAPIHFAIYNKDIKLFNFLISKKINVNVCCRGEERYSALMLAVLENADEIVKMLLKMESLHKNFVNSYQKGALCCAVEMNNKRMVQLLTDNGVMATPGTLYRADIYGDDYITGRVLQTRDADFYTPQQQHTLIYSAVVKGKVNSLKLLLKHGFQLNHRPEYLCPVEEDPLFHATLQNNPDMVSVLLDHKADISRKIYGTTSYDLARILDLKNVCVILKNELERKHLLVKAELQNDSSPFMTILTLAGVNKKEFISKLVLKGLDINDTAGHGFNPLHESINREDEAMVKHLLQCGADPNRQSAEPGYMTPLHIAIIKGNLNLVKMLLSLNVKMEVVRPVLVLWGSDTYYTDWIADPKIMPRHRSSLCDAVCRNFVTIAHFLLEAGNDIAEEDPESVKFIIKHTKSESIRRQLLDHMQTPRSLGVLCRNYLRRMHRHDIQEFVEKQELPHSLKQSLLLQDSIEHSLFVKRDNKYVTC